MPRNSQKIDKKEVDVPQRKLNVSVMDGSRKRKTKFSQEFETGKSPVLKSSKLSKTKNLTKNDESELKKSAKRKINFNEVEIEAENNNNASVSSRQVIKNNVQTRSKTGTGLMESGKHVDGHVNWMKEFMNKVQRSNERFRAKEDSNAKTSLQETRVEATKTTGDGVETSIVGIDVSDEELDYDDDLCLEDDNLVGSDIQLTGNESGTAKTLAKTSGVLIGNRRVDDFKVNQNISNVGSETNQPSTSGDVDTHDTHTSQSTEITEEEKLMNNPVVQRMMKRFISKQFQSLQKQSETPKGNGPQNENTTGTVQGMLGTDKGKVVEQNKAGTVGRRNETIKSPSDTTIYAPALQKRLTPDRTGVGLAVINNQEQGHMDYIGQGGGCPRPASQHFRPNDINEISTFVEAVRLDQHPDDGQIQQLRANETEQAQLHAERSIIEAEKFRATIQEPGRMITNDFNVNGECVNLNIMNIGSGVSDDDFFHLTCHIEPSLIHKIEKGEFVELEKLLPKDKIGRNSEENRLEWVQKMVEPFWSWQIKITK